MQRDSTTYRYIGQELAPSCRCFNICLDFLTNLHENIMQDRRLIQRGVSNVAAKKSMPAKPRIRLVSQVTFTIRPRKGEDIFTTTVSRILKWIDKRAGGKLPQQAWDGKSFDLSEIGAQRTAAELLNDPKYWAARLDDADKSVPQRTWVTEIGVGVASDDCVLFGCRLICTTRGDDVHFDRSIPGFVRHILADSDAELDGRRIGKKPWIISTEDDVVSLVELLENRERENDVLVISLPENSTKPTDALISPSHVHTKVMGAAHVCVLTGPASIILSERIGHQLSVYKQSVRTYKPGFRPWIDQPSNHPFATAGTIRSWDTEVSPFESWLTDQILSDSVYGKSDRLPSFNTVRQHALQEQLAELKATGGSDDELRCLFERDNEELRKQLDEQKELYDGLLETAEDERQTAHQETSAAKQQAFDRLQQIRSLERRLAQTSQSTSQIPDELDSFQAWCEENLGSSIEITNRAHQGVRKSDYHNPGFIYETLLLFRDYYVPMRVDPSPEKREAYSAELTRLNLEESFTGEGVNNEQYTVYYGGRRRALDKHLKGGNSRDRKYQFRLYFFWDESDEVVVVGWLPSHLDNRMS